MLNYQCCLNMEPLPVLIEAAQESCHSRYIALKSVLPGLAEVTDKSAAEISVYGFCGLPPLLYMSHGQCALKDFTLKPTNAIIYPLMRLPPAR